MGSELRACLDQIKQHVFHHQASWCCHRLTSAKGRVTAASCAGDGSLTGDCTCWQPV